DVEAGSAFTISNHPGAEPNSPTTSYNIKEKVIPDLARLKMKEIVIDRFQESHASDGSIRLSPNLRNVFRDTILIFPRNTTVTNLRPIFHWQSPSQNARYQISLFCDGKLLWCKSTQLTQLATPKPLEWGKSYQWEVLILKNSFPTDRLEKSEFWTIEPKQLKILTKLSEEIRNNVQPLVSSEYFHFLMAHVNLKYELRDEAIAHLQSIVVRDSTLAFPHEALCRLYADKTLYFRMDKEYTRWQQYLAQSTNKRELVQ
ncbi:hypothetical protein L0128_13045, partial [candidate division KSB1 bacterium]|nr:hypothetical protein [candidate division KSB1 bacterium]